MGRAEEDSARRKGVERYACGTRSPARPPFTFGKCDAAGENDQRMQLYESAELIVVPSQFDAPGHRPAQMVACAVAGDAVPAAEMAQRVNRAMVAVFTANWSPAMRSAPLACTASQCFTPAARRRKEIRGAAGVRNHQAACRFRHRERFRRTDGRDSDHQRRAWPSRSRSIASWSPKPRNGANVRQDAGGRTRLPNHGAGYALAPARVSSHCRPKNTAAASEIKIAPQARGSAKTWPCPPPPLVVAYAFEIFLRVFSRRARSPALFFRMLLSNL